jgi:hypothetical protein
MKMTMQFTDSFFFFHILAEVSNIASPIIPVGGSSNGKRRGPNPLSTYLKDR